MAVSRFLWRGYEFCILIFSPISPERELQRLWSTIEFAYVRCCGIVGLVRASCRFHTRDHFPAAQFQVARIFSVPLARN